MSQVDVVERDRHDTAVPGMAAAWRSVSRSLAVAIFLLAGLVLIGRLAQRTLPGFVGGITFSTSAAWLFLLSSLSLWLRDGSDGALRRYGRLCGAGTFVGAFVGVSALIERGAGDAYALSPQAATAFALLGLGLLLLDLDVPRRLPTAQVTSLLVLAIGLVTLIGYVNSVPILYETAPYPPISIHESIALLLLGVAALAARPDTGILRLMISNTAGGFLARVAPAVVVALPIGMGWAALTGQRRGWHDTALTVSLLTFATTTFFAVFIVRVAATLDLADLRRSRAESLLRLRARQRAAVAELGQLALTSIDETALAGEAVRLAVDALKAHGGEVLRQEADGSLRAIVGRGPGWIPDATLEPSSVPAKVLATGHPSVVTDLAGDHRLKDPRLSELGVVSAAFVPVLSSGHRHGVLAVYALESRGFAQDEVHLLQTVAGILAAARDRAAGERALRLSEQKFSGLFRSSPDAIALVGLADERVMEINESVMPLTGWSRDEVLGQRLSDLELWGDARTLAAIVQERASVRNVDIELKTRSGETRAGLCSTELLTLEGEPHMLVVVRDISDRRRVQAAIQDANERLARWVNELEDRGREISLLSEMGELLQSCAAPDEACRISVKVARQLLPGSSGALCLFAEAGGLVEPAAVWGGLSEEEGVFSLEECWALRRGRPHAASDVDSGPVCAHVRGTQSRTYLCVPMIAQGEAIGVLHVRQAGAAFPDDTMTAWLSEPKQRLVIAIADHTALALANLRLRDTLRNQSIRDQLTGLHNRRYMHEALERELLRARRAQWPVGVLLLDLDKFKAVNDTHGHDAGDEVLKGVSRLLQSRLRAEDIVCRHGGEEFVVVLPQTTPAATIERAEEIRAAVRALPVLYRGRTLGPLTVSIGVATVPSQGDTIASLMEAADAALYRAKARGGDCVEPPDSTDHPRSA